MFKINWDAAVAKQTGRIGLGLIARDCRGKVIMARNITKSILVDPTTVEAIAALHGVLLGQEIEVT
jgi:hypothetical protein